MPLARWVELQLCKLVEKAPSGPQWAHDVKFDGYRIAARIERNPRQLAAHRNQARAPTAIIAAPRFSTGVGPTASTPSSALRRPRPCAGGFKCSMQARRCASRPRRETARSAASRNSSTAVQVCASDNGVVRHTGHKRRRSITVWRGKKYSATAPRPVCGASMRGPPSGVSLCLQVETHQEGAIQWQKMTR